MIRRIIPFILGLIITAVFAIVITLSMNGNVAVLQPQGVIANQQRELIFFTVALGMIVIIPVFVMLFAFAWRYRASNKTAKYTPNVSGNKVIESIWWGVPIVIIVILSIVTFVSTHDLDPYKALASNKKPISVEVVSLEWRWLFIYPDLGIATINDLRFPEQNPVNFSITGDSPMSSFWIPSLGSQIYAMNGMTTKLHLEADSIGEFRGSNTNISGEGYAKMNFTAKSTSKSDFTAWSDRVRASDNLLDWERYKELRKPSSDASTQSFVLKDPMLKDKILAQYMNHDTGHNSTVKTTTETKDTSMQHNGMSH